MFKNLHQAADELKVKYQRLWRHCRANKLRHHKVGSVYALDAEQFDAVKRYFQPQVDPNGVPNE